MVVRFSGSRRPGMGLRALAGLVLAGAGLAPSQAAVQFVTNGNDSGAGSLRAAIQALPAGEANEIRMQMSGLVTIALASSLPNIPGTSVLLDGAMSLGAVTIDGQDAHRLLVSGSPSVTIRNITLRRGVAASNGGGCLAFNGNTTYENIVVENCRAALQPGNANGGGSQTTGTLTVRRSVFRNNLARGNGGSGSQAGGAIYHLGGTVLIEDSLFEGNRSEVGTGFFVSGGAVLIGANANATIQRSRFVGNSVGGTQSSGGALECSSATCLVAASWFADNVAEGSGGAIAGSRGVLTLRNVTLHHNRANIGGGLYGVGDNIGALTLDLRNVTFNDNEATNTGFGHAGSHIDLYLDVAVARMWNTALGPTAIGNACLLRSPSHTYSGVGFNRTVDASCNAITGSDSAVLDAALFRFGAPEFTGAVEALPLRPASALIDAGSPEQVGTGIDGVCDERDIADTRRVLDGDGDGNARCDVGALEQRSGVRGVLSLDDPPLGRAIPLLAPAGFNFLGSDVANVGDIDGDNIDDLGVVALQDPSGQFRGGAFVLYGRNVFPASVPLDALDASSGFEIRRAGSRQIARIARAGDFNGDGDGDVLVAAEGLGAGNAGAAYAVYGGFGPASVDLSAPDGGRSVQFGASSRNTAGFGSCIAALGDFDGDGRDDIAIGRRSNGQVADRGQVYVVYGLDGSLPVMGTIDLDASSGVGARVLRLDTADVDSIGEACAPASDVNGDGLDELLVGSPARRAGHSLGPVVGGAHLLFSRGEGAFDLSQLTGLDGQTWIGSSSGTGTVLSSGPIVGDGRTDFLIGTANGGFLPGTRNDAYLLDGNTLGAAPITLEPMSPAVHTLLRDDGPDRGLLQARIIPDFDRDGRADLVTTAPFESNSRGRVNVLLSGGRTANEWPPTLLDVEAESVGANHVAVIGRSSPGAGRLGASLDTGDFNGDGRLDLIAGAPNENRAWLLLGTDAADLEAGFTGLPASLSAGANGSGTLTCRNRGPQAAAIARCEMVTPSGGSVACTPAVPVATLAVNATISCPIAFTGVSGGTTLRAVAYARTEDGAGSNNDVSVTIPNVPPSPLIFSDGFEGN